ncbi:class A beta-lactamase-related serine hydrolase [Streptomyces sp. WAC05374]|uniref:serine hydrolase domain-containing protein n=1 Tax=Streptomyces sp. WAC05374 TaxID=2487420 RepID=UPI000F87DEB8|nr:serine hydrolase domain-containing protein [Streptomyces sp. WAC05374]RST09108.1 class A beta-lactamase-related serine hydrolase [Streptomyces sp. WAC05374]TDF42567.1 class A beta-lactamase-related serine hydrolase [Streptomyces sp. WAC05374]TDF51131.1 class A beta-lactamase-related serine hydrolase [Streptomyces sp. WAC05374]TDF52438.1 class A beta-lactamase-related serine hydrolase [Streptomyces sp. WAC05374]
MTNATRKTARSTTLITAGALLAAVTASALPVAGDAVAVAVAPPPPPGATPAPHDLNRKALRESIAGLPDRTMSGALVRVTGRDGRWTGTSGTSVPGPGAHIRIGSVTKLFTSAVALQLVGEGRIGMDDTVGEVAPGLLPAGYEGITLGQLLSHTSGLQRPTCFRPGTPEVVVASALSCGTPAAPGSAYRYNGVNYFIVGLMIERVTGRPYEREVRDRILRPLGLRHTSIPAAGDWSMPEPYTRAAVVVPGSDALRDVSRADPYPWAEGGMISNAPDLTRFLTALLGGRLLRPAQQELLFTMPAGVTGAEYSLGGVMRTELPGGVVVWGKSGSYSGYTSGAFATEDLRRVLVYSTNPTGRDEAEERKRIMRIAAAAF